VMHPVIVLSGITAGADHMTLTMPSASGCRGRAHISSNQISKLNLHVTMDAPLPGRFSIGRSGYTCNHARRLQLGRAAASA